MAFVVAALLLQTAASAQPYDALIYGSTPGGIQAAAAAASEGLTVLLVSPTARVGGLVAGGLGATDRGNITAIGGASLAFFNAVCAAGKAPPCWEFPPHRALSVFQGILAASPRVSVLYNMTLIGASKSGSTVTSITVAPTALVEAGAAPGGAAVDLAATYFADATYEGDLIAAAGVSFAVGREGRADFGEDHAGVLEEPSKYGSHQFHVNIDPRWPNGTLLPQVSAGPPGAVGARDGKVQAYNFRLCMTQNKSNFAPFPRPPGYDGAAWELARRYLLATNTTHISSLMNLSPVGEGKTDTNNNGAVSTDCIGCSWGYPDATPAARRAIWAAHYEYQAGFFWFLQHDEALPQALREDAASWGLAADEFVETDNWPPQLYVREARRMRGAYVFSQMDRQFNLTKEDSIGLFSCAFAAGEGGGGRLQAGIRPVPRTPHHARPTPLPARLADNIDSHHAQRYAVANASGLRVLNEGDFELFGGPPGQIPYRVITPVRSEATNLLAPVPLSASACAARAPKRAHKQRPPHSPTLAPSP